MQRQGIVPNRIVYNTQIAGCKPDRASEVFQAMQRQGLLPDKNTYKALIGNRLRQPRKRLRDREERKPL